MQINYTTILKGLPPKNCEKHRILANTPTAKIAWQEGTPFRQAAVPPAEQGVIGCRKNRSNPNSG